MSKLQQNYHHFDFEEIQQKIEELEEENQMLKESVEELIKVNTQLTESIEEFNSENLQQEYQTQQIQQMQNTIETLTKELERVKSQSGGGSKGNNRQQTQILQQKEAESLVVVLEELIDSFKNMQNRYEQEIQDLQTTLEQYRQDYMERIKRLEESYSQKIGVLEPIMVQMNRKDRNLAYIEERLYQIEQQKPAKSTDNKEVATLRKQVQLKQTAIGLYKELLEKLKLKFMERI